MPVESMSSVVFTVLIQSGPPRPQRHAEAEQSAIVVDKAGVAAGDAGQVDHLAADEVEGARLGGQEGGPVGGIERRRAELGRHLGVPAAELRAVMDVPRANTDNEREKHQQAEQRAPAETSCPTHQRPLPPKDRK